MRAQSHDDTDNFDATTAKLTTTYLKQISETSGRQFALRPRACYDGGDNNDDVGKFLLNILR